MLKSFCELSLGEVFFEVTLISQVTHKKKTSFTSRVMADGRVYASSKAISVEQREFSEQDITDPAKYASSLKTDELKAERMKRGLKRSGNNSVLIDRLRAAAFDLKTKVKSRLRGAARTPTWMNV